MKVEQLKLFGCLNWQETDVRLRQAVLLAGVDAGGAVLEFPLQRVEQAEH